MASEKLPSFDPQHHNITDWLEQFDLQMEVRAVDRALIKSNLLASLSMTVYATLKSLLAPDAISDAKFDLATIKTTIKTHFGVKINIHVARHQFAKLHQHPSESVLAFSLRMRQSAPNCEFAGQFDERCRDQFIIGLRDDKIRASIYGKAATATTEPAGGSNPLIRSR